MNLFKKIIVMALLGSLGAALGALAGEPLFWAKPKPQRNPRDICLLFDVSGSMNEVIHRPDGQGVHSQLEALQEAAKDFLARQDLQLDSIGLAVFSSGSYVVSELRNDVAALQQAVLGLTAHGGTNLGRGLEVAQGLLKRRDRERWILLFSDGKPGNFSTHESAEAAALRAAKKLRQAGIQIVAIGTRLADEDLLAEITSSPQNVIISDPTALAEAFRKSEKVINNQHMLASHSTVEGFMSSVLWAGIWAALIAVGAALGLVAGTNRHLHRRFLRVGEVLIILLGGVITGLLAGAAGQSLYYLLSDVHEVDLAKRGVSWVLLGLGIGYGMGFLVPNLPRKRASVAAGVGGAVAAFCFLTLPPMVAESLTFLRTVDTDAIGRVLGAAILGLSAGLAIVLVEAICPDARLIVHWNDKERSALALGATPILVGSSLDAHVLLAEGDSPVPIMARIRQTDSGPTLEDGQTNSERALTDGEVLDYGRIRIEVRAPAGSGSGGGSRASKAPTTTAATRAAADLTQKAKTAKAPPPPPPPVVADFVDDLEDDIDDEVEELEVEEPVLTDPVLPDPADEPAEEEPAAADSPKKKPDPKPSVSSSTGRSSGGGASWMQDHL